MRAGDLVVGPWGARFRGRRFPCAHGRGGIVPASAKREGDGASPAGVWHLTALRCRPDRVRLPGAAPILPRDGWSEDPADPAYNTAIRHPHAFPAERMRRADPLYDLCAVTDHNTPAVPGMGSAIFVHLWRRPRHPTAGCIAFRRDHLAWILARWSARSRLVIRERGGL